MRATKLPSAIILTKSPIMMTKGCIVGAELPPISYFYYRNIFISMR